MKKMFLFLLVAITIFYFGCDETTDPGDDNGGVAVTKIEGKLPNWTLGTNKIIKFFVETDGLSASFGEASISADGSFSITLNTPSASQLSSLVESDSNCTGNQTVNPSDTKGLGGGAHFQIYSGTNLIGEARYGKRSNDTSSSVGDVEGIWVYLSKDATMNGTQTCTYTYGSYTETFSMSMNNLKGKMGWNKYFMTKTVSSSNASGYSLSATEPSGIGWRVDIWGGSSGSTISGTLPNWTYGTGKTIKFMVEKNSVYHGLGDASISANGSFTLNLQTPSASLLSLISEVDSSCTGTLTVTPSDAKAAGGDANFKIYDGTTLFGEAQYAKMLVDTSESAGDVFAVWVYIDKNCTVSGTQTCVKHDGANFRTETMNFSITCDAGWNKLFVRMDAKTSTSETRSVFNNEPAGLSWKFWKY